MYNLHYPFLQVNSLSLLISWSSHDSAANDNIKHLTSLNHTTHHSYNGATHGVNGSFRPCCMLLTRPVFVEVSWSYSRLPKRKTFENNWSSFYRYNIWYCLSSTNSVKAQQVVKVIWRKATSPLQTDGPIVFARWHQCALPRGHIIATWWIRLNLCFIRHTQVHNTNGKSIDPAIFAQLTAECRRACPGMSFPLIIAPSNRDLGPSNTCFLGPTRVHNVDDILISSAVFAQLTAQHPYAAQWAALSPSKLPIPMGDLEAPI